MREIAATPAPSGRRRRWFNDDFFDLWVWLEDDGSIWGFQLCYDKSGSERAFTWTVENGHTHARIDDGETIAGRNRAPILVADGLLAVNDVALAFEQRAGAVDREVGDFVLARLDECPADLRAPPEEPPGDGASRLDPPPPLC